MSFYTSGIQTQLIDSVFHRDSFRTEFRFDADKTYLTNMRLCGVGATVSTAGLVSNYNALTGAWGVIRQISLLDGNETLCNVQNFNLYTGFKNFKRTNENSANMNTFLSENLMGYVWKGLDLEGELSQIVPVRNPLVNAEEAQVNIAGNGELGWLSLKDCLPFLGASDIMPTSLFRHLRLVVEYSQDPADYARRVYTGAAGTPVVIEPFLVADVMMNSDTANKLMMNYKGVVWNELEVDRVNVPSIEGVTEANTSPVQETQLLVNGFDNKRVSRMVMITEPTSPLSYRVDSYRDPVLGVVAVNAAFGKMGSMYQKDMELQVRVNGGNLFPTPLKGGNRRLGLLVDTWGECLAPLGNMDSPASINDIGNGGTEMPEALQRLGSTDYTGWNLGGTRVQELILQYKRNGLYVTGGYVSTPANPDAEPPVEQVITPIPQNLNRFNQRVNLVLYGEVQKSLVPTGNGRYVISYV